MYLYKQQTILCYCILHKKFSLKGGNDCMIYLMVKKVHLISNFINSDIFVNKIKSMYS